tara:strand:- start:138 stop:1196 length:1059 start_codon:yes stop_codon:yes gene_type:complete
MGLIGNFLYYDDDCYYNNHLDNLLNIYDNSNIITYNRLQLIYNNANHFVILNENYSEFKSFVDKVDLSINITTMEKINIHIPSDICNNKFTYNYEKIEKNFNINLTNEELSQTDISRIIIYNNPIDKFFNENLSNTQQNDYNSFYINNNNTLSDIRIDYMMTDISTTYFVVDSNIYSDNKTIDNKLIDYSFNINNLSDYSLNILDPATSHIDPKYVNLEHSIQYIDMINSHYKNVIYKNCYYRIEGIRFFEGNDLSFSDNNYDNSDKNIKKKLILDSLIYVYENKNLITEIKDKKHICFYKFRTEIRKEDLNNIWGFCYSEFKKYITNHMDYVINKNEVFKFFDVSSSFVDK